MSFYNDGNGSSSLNYIERFGETDKNIRAMEVGEEQSQLTEEEEEQQKIELDLLRSKYQELSGLLPERELDMIELSILFEKDQTSIGKIFNVSQGDVSYRIKRLKERSRYLQSLPEVDHKQMEEDLTKFLGKDLTNILMLLLKYTSQSKVGKMLGLSQGKIRHRYIRSLKRIEDICYENPYFLIYFDYLNKLQGNYNSLRSLDVQDRWKHKY